MSKFKVGDHVVGNHPNVYGITNLGWKGEVINISSDGRQIAVQALPGSGSGTYTVKEEYFDLIKSTTITTTIMTNLTQKFRLLTKSEPEKTFIEKGIMDINENLTAEGRDLFNAFLFEKHKAEFKTEVVDKLVDEPEKK